VKEFVVSVTLTPVVNVYLIFERYKTLIKLENLVVAS